MPDGLFRLIADGTGIQENDIGLLDIGSGVKTIFLKNRRNNLTVREIHLAAIALDIKLAAIASVIGLLIC